MGLLMLLLLFLCFQEIPCDQSSTKTWIARVPQRIPALQGYCVVIPCTYSYPEPSKKHTRHWWKGFWKKGNQIISTSVPHWSLPKEYKQRTLLLGNVRLRTCTMLLDGVRSTDTGPFFFRIEMSQNMRFSYKKNAVTIDVIREPQPPSLSVQVNGRITASCSVTHSCPFMPPQLSWNHRGTITQQFKKLNAWKWETVSKVTFYPLMTDYNTTITCKVKYRGGKQAQSSTIIKM